MENNFNFLLHYSDDISKNRGITADERRRIEAEEQAALVGVSIGKGMNEISVANDTKKKIKSG